MQIEADVGRMSGEALSNKCFTLSKALNSLEIRHYLKAKKLVVQITSFSSELHAMFVRTVDIT